ncbi:MAG TPA: UbiA family prenyltransferase [Polyangiaceae bacterium]
MRSLLDLFVHLRLHYQLLFLSPLFAWGFALGGGAFSARAGWGFLAFHVFLYGGITAYNSYYDRDEGPVGGLRKPPPVSRGLLGFSLAVQLVGLGLSLLVGWQLLLLYLIVMLLSVAYSHPRFRWKARPLLSLLVVAFGQGAVGFRAGWLCAATPPLPLLSSGSGLLGMAAAVLLTTGFYPLSQLYQIEEDRQRGDATFAVVYGPSASFRFALGCLMAGGACIALVAFERFGVLDALLALAAQSLLWWVVLRWYRRFRSDVIANFVTLHRLQFAVSAGTLGYVSLRLLLR